MTTALLVGAVAAGLACPVHMMWRMRRRRQATCMPGAPERTEVAALRERQRTLAARIDRVRDAEPAGRQTPAGHS